MTKMNNKYLLVFVLAIVGVFALASVSATVEGNFEITRIEVNDITAQDVSNGALLDGQIVAGETVKIEVWFTADFNGSMDFDKDITVTAELDTGKKTVDATVSVGLMEDVDAKKVTLSLEVPFELKDDLTSVEKLTIEIEGAEVETEYTFDIKVERQDYNAVVKSVSVSQSVEAGETFPVDVVLKNLGYLDLDDVYVTASISALGIEKTSYFGDMVSLEDNCNSWCNDCCDNDDDDEDSASGRLTLKVPYSAEAGIYTLEVEVTNDDTTTTVVKQIVVKNDFSNVVIVSSYEETVATNTDAVYELLIVNPTDKVKVYRVVTDSTDLSVSAENSIVAVPAGSSKTVKVMASADSEGEYNFDVNIFSGEELVSTTTLSLTTEGKAVADLTVVLTVILAIIFIVLLVVLIVLIGKKPAKTEEFGESYY